MLKAKNVKVVMLVSIVKAQKAMVQLLPMLLNVYIAPLAGHRKLEVPNVNRARLGHTVMWKVKNVKVVMLASIVKVKKVMV
jgi:hypothetical protein